MFRQQQTLDQADVRQASAYLKSLSIKLGTMEDNASRDSPADRLVPDLGNLFAADTPAAPGTSVFRPGLCGDALIKADQTSTQLGVGNPHPSAIQPARAGARAFASVITRRPPAAWRSFRLRRSRSTFRRRGSYRKMSPGAACRWRYRRPSAFPSRRRTKRLSAPPADA